MAEFFTAHRIDGLSEKAVRERAEKLVAAAKDEPVELVRSVCDLDAGRMLCEWVAADRDAVLAYLKDHDMDLLGEDEWIFHVDLEEPPATPPLDLGPAS